MPITPIGNSATGTEIATAVNALISLVQDGTIGNTALGTLVNHVSKGNNALDAKVNDTAIGNTALGTLVNHVSKGNNALDAKVNSESIGNTALGALVNDADTGINKINTKLDEIYDQDSFPSESVAAEPVVLEIPDDEMAVTISAVPRTFTFNVAKFNFNGTDYIAQDVADDIAIGSGDAWTAAKTLITALVAAGSVITDGEGSGILTETT